MCNRCFVSLCKYAVIDNILTCPKCKETVNLNNISFIKSNRELAEEDAVPININGLFSTKITNVTKKLMELISQDPKVKILVFSSVSFLIFNLNML